ncbi:MAG: redoxin domain-containing protein [Verrucomicrobia bacterium]|nr:redoxin domain-containing protein [Verrucomicrobiota bacterium]
MNSRFRGLVSLCASLWMVSPAMADHPEDKTDADAAAAGHSLHGEAFNQGPRQAAYLMEGMPKINFPITTKIPLAQKFFLQGVGQLHGFWYFEAERSFRQVAALDTNCAMAYWGMALANANNAKRAREFVERANQLTNGLSRRECLWIEAAGKLYPEDKKSAKKAEKKSEKSSTNASASTPAVAATTSSDTERDRAFVRSLEQLIEEFPDDIEAKAFLVWKIWDNQGKGLRITSHTAVDALANDVLAVDPMHPVHHYRIHLWDGEKERRALNSAALCGQGAAGIAHMWHMPGHIYSKLNRFADAAWQQEASARVDHAHMMRDRVLPDEIHNYAHNNEWLIRNLGYLGRVREGIDLAKNMVELPRHPKYNTLTAYLSPTNEISTNSVQAYQRRTSSARHGRTSLVSLLSRYELWDQTIALADTLYLEPTDIPDEQVRRLVVLGTAYFEKGEVKKGEEQIAGLETVLKVQREQRRNAADEAEEKARKDKIADDKLATNMTEALRSHASRIKKTESAIDELKVYAALATKKEVTKEMLESVKDLPKEQRAQILLRTGDKEKAETYAKEASNSATNQVQPLANYVEVLWRVGKTNEAAKAFEQLRVVAGGADLDLPVLQRLAPLAASLKLPADWRTPPPQSTDVGQRPALDSLGPFRWQPTPAPEWTLADANGKQVSLKQYRGKPVVVLFYLGYGCVHCLEQLNAFGPATKDFAEAGISLVAISTDTVEGLKKTFAKSKSEDGFPFPLLSDEPLAAFKSFRAFDDFENMPLHGTFLIDGQGLVRWQDISFEPFTDTKFLLAESKRLLGLTLKSGLVAAKKKKMPPASGKGAEQLMTPAATKS